MNEYLKSLAFCSISTVSHMGRCGLLNESLRAAGHQQHHYILVVDDPEKKHADAYASYGFDPVYLGELQIEKIDELTAKYNPFELCNVLKPFFMRWLLQKHSDIQTLIYLDSDIYVYSDFSDVVAWLNQNNQVSVALTPHLFDYDSYAKRKDYKIEKLFFDHGLYNAGFYGLKNDASSLKFLDWQANKLFSFGYHALGLSMFVDQKILDLAPILFDFVGIYRNPAYNVAYWNYSPGLLAEKDGTYFVGDKRLVFFHFSQVPQDDVLANFVFSVSENDRRIFSKLLSEYRNRLDNPRNRELRSVQYAYGDRYTPPEMPEHVDAAARLQEQLEKSTRDYVVLQAVAAQAKQELNGIYGSRTWRVAVFLRKISSALRRSKKI
jgi:hypothetical protein